MNNTWLVFSGDRFWWVTAFCGQAYKSYSTWLALYEHMYLNERIHIIIRYDVVQNSVLYGIVSIQHSHYS